jgi:biopolymer transport protein ExbD
MRIKKTSGSGDLEMNLTPLIDVVFNLLIFFMLTTQFMSLDLEELTLPLSTTGEDKNYTDFRNVVINVVNPANPAVRVLGETFTYAGLVECLKGLAADAEREQQKMNVILRADADMPYEDVARCMLAAGTAKIEGWWIQVDLGKTGMDLSK